MQVGRPHNEVAQRGRRCADPRANRKRKRAAQSHRYARGHQDVDLRFLGHELSQLGRHNGNNKYGERPTGAASLVGSVTNGG